MALLAVLEQEFEHLLAADERDIGNGDLPAGVASIANEGRAWFVAADRNDGINIGVTQMLDLGAKAVGKGLATEVGCLGGQFQMITGGKGAAHAFPAPSAVGIALIKDSDPLAAQL